MRILILGMAGLLVLGGGGAGAYFFLGQGKAEAAVGETAAHQDAGEAKAEKGKGGGHGESAGPVASFVQLDPLILPIIDENGISQVISLVIAIEVKDEPSTATVRKLSPRLKDAYIQDMYGVLNKRVAMQGGIVQVGMIKDRLNSVTRKVLGEDMVKDVLLQVVHQRPI